MKKPVAAAMWDEKQPDLARVLVALEWQVKQADWLKNGGEFIPHPSTWLHQERWEDEPARGSNLSSRSARALAAAAAWVAAKGKADAER